MVLAVNKMDLVDYSEEVFNRIVSEFKDFASRLDNLVEMTFIPISALQGAVERDQAGAATAEPGNGDDEEDSAQEGSKRVSLKQRAWPLLDLMKTALAAGQRITWGV